jgi:SAM-dependent methyltransferase
MDRKVIMKAVHKTSARFLAREFWIEENSKYSQPYLRLEKCAGIVNQLARGEPYDLLDVGCGPATLALLLDANINYFGIDLAIHSPAPNLHEVDFAKHPIGFDDRRFDLVVAAGVFEYMGKQQARKLGEIRSLLKEEGKFIVTYTNFHHLRNKGDYYPYNNVQPLRDFRRALEEHFHVDQSFPSSHNWKVTEPRRPWLKKINALVNFNIPIVSPLFAVNYFFICS